MGRSRTCSARVSGDAQKAPAFIIAVSAADAFVPFSLAPDMVWRKACCKMSAWRKPASVRGWSCSLAILYTLCARWSDETRRTRGCQREARSAEIGSHRVGDRWRLIANGEIGGD